MFPVAAETAPSESIGISPMIISASVPTQSRPTPTVSDAFAKDAIIAWFRGEFAAANAIIDALCHHLSQLENHIGSQYRSVFAAIHRRRLNWIPILQMQKYYSIAEVTLELRNVAERKVEEGVKYRIANKIEETNAEKEQLQQAREDESTEHNENGSGEVVELDSNKDDSPEGDITDTEFQEVPAIFENTEICSNHSECEERPAQISMTKGFVEKEPVKRRMVNVVRGLKLYEDIFTETELSKLTDFVNELRAAGWNGELPGETFILYNQQIKGKKRELIQLGVPIFGHIKEESRSAGQKSLIEPIPALLQSVIAHLAQWHLISENRKPNGCIINYFDEEEYSQPFLKPPHLEQPIITIVLAESTIAFGRSLACDSEGNYKGSLMLSLKGGSLLVMRGNSADMARHGMCPSPNRRVSITFFKTRTETASDLSAEPPLTRAVTPWKPGHPNLQTASDGMLNGYERMGAVTKWVVPQAPVVMLSSVYSMVSSTKRIRQCGTGVFLPWTVRSRKHFKHVPPRAIRAQLHELQSSVEPHMKEPNSSSGICIEGQWPKLSSDSNKAQTITTL